MLEKSFSLESSVKNLEVICQSTQKHPSCPHGPTLLFRLRENGNIKEYFACSAFRNRKGCSFYIEKNDLNDFSRVYQKKNVAYVDIDRIKAVRDKLNFQNSELGYCHQCNELFHKSFSALHKNHDSTDLTTDLIETPTQFLRPLSNDEAEAQYFFKDNTLNFLSDLLNKLKISKVVCIGVPRLHEHLKKLYKNLQIKSILLDFDHRFFYFNSNSEYFYFNMFNYHFFEGQEKQEMFERFLKVPENERILLVTDPPFGCRTEPLINVLKKISLKFKNINKCMRVLPIIWIFPYYMEHYIKGEMPEMEMLDYKINYENHESYSDGINARKYGSPVRLFTNIPLNLIELPKVEGYKKCNICQKWTYSENLHCKICNICPSKNGESYKHCYLCQLCVKPKYVHCKNCRRCTQKENHNCLVFQKNVRCWICKEIGHLEVSCDKSKQGLRTKILKLKEKKERICLICFKKGHNESKCRRNKIL